MFVMEFGTFRVVYNKLFRIFYAILGKYLLEIEPISP